MVIDEQHQRSAITHRATERPQFLYIKILKKVTVIFLFQRKTTDFYGTPLYKKALWELKYYILRHSLLAKPREGKKLHLYLTVEKVVASIGLFLEE